MGASDSPTLNRRRRERKERRESILRAARKQFFSRGFSLTTVDDIAAEAEISKGTIYLYFPSKETLLANLLEEGLDLLVDHLASAFDLSVGQPAAFRLDSLASAYLSFFQQHPHYYRLLMAFDRREFQESVDAGLYREILGKSNRGLLYVVQAIEQGVHEGVFHVRDPRQAAGAIWAMLHGVYAILGHPLRQEMVTSDLRTLYQVALDLAIRGLTAREPD